MKLLLPICVDLDGTLIREDVTIKAAMIYFKRCFLNVLVVSFWLVRGIAYFKHRLAKAVELDPSSLNYNESLLSFLSKKKKEGHRIFLATACNKDYAKKIADYLNRRCCKHAGKFFVKIFASTDSVNLKSEKKAQMLTCAFGEKGFIYAGNSKDDIPVWNKSSECILVSPTKGALDGMREAKYLLFS